MAASALDVLLDAAVAVGLTHELAWWRVADIIHHAEQVDWLNEHGIPEPMRWPEAPCYPPVEKETGFTREQLAELEARTQAGLDELNERGLP